VVLMFNAEHHRASLVLISNAEDAEDFAEGTEKSKCVCAGTSIIEEPSGYESAFIGG
jgi:hypothetical protein